jgi:amino acid adenylation domain-containing protein
MSTTFFHTKMARENTKVLPMSFAQEGLWFLEQLELGSPVNTLSATVEVSKPLLIADLRASLNLLVQRHDILRTVFLMHEEQLVQVIAPTVTIPLPLIDLRLLSADAQRAEVQRQALEQAGSSFDLTQGPLLRCTLLHLADEHFCLLLTLHRIIGDPASVGIFVHELVALYNTSTMSVPTPPVPVQYAQFAATQRETLTQDVRSQHLTYWKSVLAEAPAALDLPTDYTRPSVASLDGAYVEQQVPLALTQRLHTLSQQQAVPLESLLSAAFVVLLSRYTTQDDLLIGTISPMRRSAETQMLIGPCENSLILRTDLSAVTSFLDLLKHIDEGRQEAATHDALPFDLLLKDVSPPRSRDRAALFQVLLRLPYSGPTLPPGWTVSHLEVGSGTAQFDLTLELYEEADGLLSRFIYRTDLFDVSTLLHLANHWPILLESIVAEPTMSWSQLPLLSATERNLLLGTWTATQRDFPLESTFAQRFEAQVERRPDAIAVECEGVRLSYHTVNQWANQLAHTLRELGVGPEVLVALLAERSIPLLLSILAVFKAGGAYLPLDPAHPESRLRHVIEQSGCQFVLSTAAFASTRSQALQQIAEKHRPHEITFEQALQTNSPRYNLPATSGPRSLAYVIYTSGSTGTPKGAMVEQRGMLNHLYAKIVALDLDSSDHIAQTASQCFDISVWQFLAVLLVGGRVQIYPDAIAHDAATLLQRVEQQQVSILETVPSLLGAMLDTYERQDVTRPSLRALRWLVPTGEALPVSLCQRWLTCYPQVLLLNAYGPTECSDDVTHYAIIEPPPESLKSIPIGKAIPNMRLYVLDRHLQPQPIGVGGEVYVGGVGVGRGYRNDERRTQESFVADPFSEEEGARLYKTGDLGRYLPDGNLEFLGRVDFQVKVRGYRIELGEIEAVLSRLEGVREAVVGVQGEEQGEPRLVAYVVPEPGQAVTTELLKTQVKQHLPAYMMPSAFVMLDHFPLTSNGKLDRKALPVVPASSREGDAGYVAAVGLVQQQLVEMWEELLGVKPIGMRDDFFALGGDSLQAARLFDRIEQRYGKRLALSTLFAAATIEQIAHVVQEVPGEQAESRAPYVVVQAGGSRQPFFFLHGEWNGGALYTLELARALGSEQPFYLLEPYRFDGLKVPPSLEEMAATHLETLRTIQPEGPVLLGGYCNGALLAYEMARQLRAQGQAVDLLLLIDPDAPARHRWVRWSISRFCNLVGIHQQTQFAWFLCLQHIYRFVRFSQYRQANISAHAGDIEPGRMPPTPLRLKLGAVVPNVESLRQGYLNMYDWSATDYAPDLYAGDITFFWTSEEPWRPRGWRKVVKAKAGEVEIQTLPGNHITSRTDYLPILTERVSASIRKAHTRETH